MASRSAGTGRAYDLCARSVHRVDNARLQSAILSRRHTSRLPIDAIRLLRGLGSRPRRPNAVPLTEMGAGTPRWSPDAKTIAFDSNAEGNIDVYVVPATGGKPRRMTFEPADDAVPSFSRDGTFLYFSSKRSGVFEIWKLPLSGGNATASDPEWRRRGVRVVRWPTSLLHTDGHRFEQSWR